MNAIVAIKNEASALALTEDELVDVLQCSLYPGAALKSIKMVIGYCKAAGLDPMQKPVHIVPMWDKHSKSMRDVIMPGVGLYRTQAARSNALAGIGEPEFGSTVEFDLGGMKFNAPEWCRVVVRRMLPNGAIGEFAAIEYWIENYATAGKDTTAPNAMWKKRPRGQIAKCFDVKTEVLTTKGFQRFDSVSGQILQVTNDGLAPCDALPFAQDYDGEMIVADGTRLNFSVTPNHDMITTGGKIEAELLYEQATKLGNKFFIPRAPDASNKDIDIADTILQLLGYFLADGSHTGYQQFRIAVSRQYKVEALRGLVLHQRESVKRDAGRIAQANGHEIETQHDKTLFTYDYALIESFVEMLRHAAGQFVVPVQFRPAVGATETGDIGR